MDHILGNVRSGYWARAVARQGEPFGGSNRPIRGRAGRLVSWLFGTNGTKKDVICRNEAERLLKTKRKATHVSRNEPENEPEKSFRFVPVEKTNPKRTQNKPGHVVENR